MHNPEPHIIPRAIMAAVGEQAHFAVNGVDYPTPDGTAVRVTTRVVTDLADAHYQATRCTTCSVGAVWRRSILESAVGIP